jgi:hypothetical protein
MRTVAGGPRCCRSAALDAMRTASMCGRRVVWSRGARFFAFTGVNKLLWEPRCKTVGFHALRAYAPNRAFCRAPRSSQFSQCLDIMFLVARRVAVTRPDRRPSACKRRQIQSTHRSPATMHIGSSRTSSHS